jgi:exosortase
MTGIATKKPRAPFKLGWGSSIAVLAGLAVLPLSLSYFSRLWQEEHYQYFPLLIGVIVYLGWSRWKEAPPASQPLRTRWTAVGGVPALLGLTLAILYQVPIIAILSALLGLGVMGLCLASRRKVENIFGVWALCWLLVRPPWGYDEKLMGGLQAFTTLVSSRLLDFFGCLHLTEGNILTFPGKTFFVDEACSGIISLRTMLAATAVMVVFRNRPLMHACLLIAAGFFWAGVMNVIRIGIIAVAHLKFQLDLSEGWAHDLTGLGVFVLAFVGVLSTDAWLSFFLEPMRHGIRSPNNLLTRGWNRFARFGDLSLKEEDYSSEPSMVRDRSWPRWFRYGFGGVLGVLVLLQGMALIPWSSSAQAKEVTTVALEPARLLSRDAITPLSKEWQIVDFEEKSRSSRSVWGENSLVWDYARGDLRMKLAVDYYFLRWHELTICYRASGWQLDERVVLPRNADLWSTVRATCQRPASREQGLIFFDLFHTSGEPLEPVEHLLAADWKERFAPRNLALFKGAFSPKEQHDVIQVQAFLVTEEPLSAEEMASVQAEYEHFRGQVHANLIGEPGS